MMKLLLAFLVPLLTVLSGFNNSSEITIGEIAMKTYSDGVENRMTPVTYRPTHGRTLPPPNQVISSEAKNILLRHLEQRAEEKLRPKRAAAENLAPEHGSKHLRVST